MIEYAMYVHNGNTHLIRSCYVTLKVLNKYYAQRSCSQQHSKHCLISQECTYVVSEPECIHLSGAGDPHYLSCSALLIYVGPYKYGVGTITIIFYHIHPFKQFPPVNNLHLSTSRPSCQTHICLCSRQHGTRHARR